MQPTTPDIPTSVQWRMVLILCLVNAIAFIDRSVLPLLVQPIRRDLGISDTEISFLIGAAFILTYFLGAPIVGSLVDRFSRRRVLASGITLWGVSTIFCGALANYTTIFIGRCGVGAGESTSGPSSMSLIKDAFEPRFRGRAVAIWSMGASIGGGLALLGGGAILHLVGDAGSVSLPLLGIVQGWQVVLIACGIISLPIALLVFAFPEPQRRSSATGKEATLGEAFADMRARWLIFLPLFIANGATIMLSAGYSTWVPAFLGRTWHIPPSQIGLMFGLIVLILSTTSQFTAGFVVDVILKRFGVPAVPLVGVAVCFIISIPAVLIPLSTSIVLTWILLAMFNLLAASLFTIGTAAIVHLSPSSAIGKISGIHFSWIGITGYALAPTFIAVLAEKWFGGGSGALGLALSTAGGALAAVGGICLATVYWQLKRAPSVVVKKATYAA